MTSCGRPFLDRLDGWSRDGRLQGEGWSVLGGAKDALSKINPVFDTFCVTVQIVEKDGRTGTKIC
jgi:hypothetical protein